MVAMYVSLLALSLCIGCLGIILAEGRKVRQLVLAIRRAHDLADDVRALAERLEGVERSLKRLHSRAGMREVRERRANGAIPDWRDDPEGYRAAKEAELGIGKPPGRSS